MANRYKIPNFSSLATASKYLRVLISIRTHTPYKYNDIPKWNNMICIIAISEGYCRLL